MSQLTTEQKLRVKYRAALEAMPAAEVVVPAEVQQKKSSLYVVTMDGYIQLEAAFEIVKTAIEEALASRRRRTR